MEPSALNFIHVFQPGLQNQTLLLLHGTGGTEQEMLVMGKTLNPTANLLSVRGKVIEHGMARFFTRISPGVFNPEEIRVRSHELSAFIKAASSHYNFKLSELIPIGYSNGANIILSLLLTEPALFSKAVLLRPMCVFRPTVLPSLINTSLFVATGEKDRVVSEHENAQLLALLQDTGATVSVYKNPEHHNLTSSDIEKAGEWLSNFNIV